MPAYNFQARFAELVEKRIKRQTVRARRKDGKVPKVGERFVGYTGMRTKKCRKLTEGVISDVRHIMIDHCGIVVDGKQLDKGEADTFAMLDGFNGGAPEMTAWFLETHGEQFAGHLIRWL